MEEKISNDIWFSSYSPPRPLVSCSLLGIFRIRGLNQNIILSPYMKRVYCLSIGPLYILHHEEALAGRTLTVARPSLVARHLSDYGHLCRFSPGSSVVTLIRRCAISVFITSYCPCASFYSSMPARVRLPLGKFLDIYACSMSTRAYQSGGDGGISSANMQTVRPSPKRRVSKRDPFSRRTLAQST